jgi:hypothetical protein
MTVIRTSWEQRRTLKLLASSRDGANEELLVMATASAALCFSALSASGLQQQNAR